jgi:hypothetical protein
VAKSQDSPGPIGKTVRDVATSLDAIAGPDPADPATAGAPSGSFTAGLSTNALQGKRIAVVTTTTAPYPAVVSALQAAGATTTAVTIGTPSPNPPSIVGTEFKRDLNAYLAGIPIGKGANGPQSATSLQGIIDYNTANPVEGLKYQQGDLLAAQAIDLSDPATAATYASNLASGKSANQALIDGILANGTPADHSDDFDAIVVPSGNAIVGVADRAGYPVLTIPAGYGATASSAGHNPIGVTLVGTAYSDARLLADGYALEQATNVRLAPSFTNPSMWRCVPGSTFFTAELCNPGDRQLDPAVVLGGLGTTITGMGLDNGLTNDLSNQLRDVAKKAGSPTQACTSLAGFVQKVVGEAAKDTPKLTIAQAQSIVAMAYGVGGTLGCDDSDPLTPKAQAQHDVLSLVGLVAQMPINKGVAADLRAAVNDVGKQLASSTVDRACQSLQSLDRKIGDRTGGRSGLTLSQAAQLRASAASISAELGCP